MKTIETKIVSVTPEIAKYLLRFNVGNRKMREKSVKYWAGCLRTSSVTLSHQGIALVGDIANPLRVLDGQHRLQAILETGIACDFLVAMYVPENSFENLDNGLARTMTDRTKLESSQVKASTMIVGLRQTRTLKAPVSLIQKVYAVIKPFEIFVTDCKKRNFSSQAIRAAFILQQRKMGYNHAEDFQKGNFKAMPESLCALYRRQASSPLMATGSTANKELFSATWLAISNMERSRVVLPKNCNSFAYDAIDDVFPEISKILESFGYTTQSPQSAE
jgi:hypothetical protein